MTDIQFTKLVLTFDNNKTYEIYMDSNDNEDERFISEYKGNASDAVLDGNPLGVTTTDTRNISIYDPNNSLMPNNVDSPYFGYMRSGVKIEPYILEDETWKKDGVYYCNDWNTGYSEGGHEVAVLSCADRLQYILSQDIPKLPIYSGLSIKELLKSVFNAIGITDSEYYIDSSLNLTLLYGMSTDDTVGTFLNNVAQALLARINVDRDGIIQIRPALSSYGRKWYLGQDDIIKIQSKVNHSSSMYSKARLNYVKTGKNLNGNLTGNSGITLEVGLNEFNGLKISGSMAKEITDVTFELPANVDADKVTDFSFTAYQNGIDIKITNNTGSIIDDVSFTIGGRYITGIDKYEEATVVNTDAKVVNVLNVNNDLIQNTNDAKTLVNKISDYLQSTQYIVYAETTLSALVANGDQVVINAGIEKFDGIYRVVDNDTDYSPKNYYKNITMIPESTELEEVG